MRIFVFTATYELQGRKSHLRDHPTPNRHQNGQWMWIRIGINMMLILFRTTLLNPANNLCPDKGSRRAKIKKTKTRIFKRCGADELSWSWSQFSLQHF